MGKPNAITVGHRRRRVGLILLGVALMLGPVVGGGLIVSRVDPTPYKPAWWLLRELDSADATTASVAMAELGRRQAAGGLSKSAEMSLVDRALAEQADLARTWDSTWGGFVEAARAAGWLDDARWGKYARQAFVFKLEVRPTVRRGDPLPAQFFVQKPRIGPTARFCAAYRWESLRIGNATLDPLPTTGGLGFIGVTLHAWGYNGGGLDIGGDLTTPLPIGRVVLAGKVMVSIGEGSGNPMATSRPSPELASAEVSVEGAFDVLPGGGPVPYLINDPGKAGAMRAVVSASARRVAAVATSPAGTSRVVVDLVVSQPPYNLRHDALVRFGKSEVKIGSVYVSSTTGLGSNSESLHEEVDVPADAGAVDVILRLNTDGLRDGVTPTRPWGGEIVLKDVPILPAGE